MRVILGEARPRVKVRETPSESPKDLRSTLFPMLSSVSLTMQMITSVLMHVLS